MGIFIDKDIETGEETLRGDYTGPKNKKLGRWKEKWAVIEKYRKKEG